MHFHNIDIIFDIITTTIVFISFISCNLEMSNQELVDTGRKKMDETDQAIERSKQV